MDIPSLESTRREVTKTSDARYVQACRLRVRSLRPMKIGLVVPGFSSDGADWCIPVLVDVIRELSRRAEVHVFALRYPFRRDRYRAQGAEVHAFGGREVCGVARVRLMAETCAGVISEHRRSPFTVMHGIWADEPGLVSITTARILRIPALVSVMGGELVAMPDIHYGGRLSATNRLLSTLALRIADGVTAGSNHLADRARRAVGPSHDAHISSMAWGVNPQLFEVDGPRLQLAGDFRVLHVGSLVPVKDHAMLLRAIARLKESKAGLHLHLVGDGPLRSQLTDQVRRLGLGSSVTFHGHVDRQYLAPYYRAADVFAVTSRYEAQSVVALEAALCGTPIVGTAVGVVADFAPEAALAGPVGDDAWLAEALCSALQPKTGRALSNAAGRRARSHYLASHTADTLMAMYRTCSKSPRAG
jgi:glycosyltransferase involved in cell wall biosynthesis